MLASSSCFSQQNLDQVKTEFWGEEVKSSNEENRGSGFYNEFDSAGNYLGIRQYFEDGTNYFVDPQVVYYSEGEVTISTLYSRGAVGSKINQITISQVENDYYVSFLSNSAEIRRFKVSDNKFDEVDKVENATRDIGVSQSIRGEPISLKLADNSEIMIRSVDQLCASTDVTEIDVVSNDGKLKMIGSKNIKFVHVKNDEVDYLLLISLNACNGEIKGYRITYK